MFLLKSEMVWCDGYGMLYCCEGVILSVDNNLIDECVFGIACIVVYFMKYDCCKYRYEY